MKLASLERQKGEDRVNFLLIESVQSALKVNVSISLFLNKVCFCLALPVFQVNSEISCIFFLLQTSSKAETMGEGRFGLPKCLFHVLVSQKLCFATPYCAIMTSE